MATETIKVTELCKTESPSLMDFDEVELAEVLLSLGRRVAQLILMWWVRIQVCLSMKIGQSQTGTNICPPYHCVHPEESEGENICPDDSLHSFIHSGYLYSAPSRNLLRGALSPARVKEKCLKKLAERRHVVLR